ncbi:carbohydrate ABC transporter permease [Geodermatophilus sp. SYSU D00815]
MTAATTAGRRGRTLAGRRRLTGVLLTGPAVVALAVTVAFPVLWTVSLSFQEFSLSPAGPPATFAGLDNYSRVLGSSAFQEALLHSIGFVVTSLVVEVVLGLAIAVLLNRETRGRKVMRLVIALPLMVAPVVASLAWKFLFSNDYGLINRGLSVLGLPTPSWFADEWLSRITILVTNVWLALPFVVLVLLAGLANVPRELEEAARTDGASPWRAFWHITLPLLKPALLIILVIRLADAFRVFDSVYVLTGGGPGGSTEVMSSYLYRLLFTNTDFAGGAAAAVVFVLVIAASAWAVFALLRDKEDAA